MRTLPTAFSRSLRYAAAVLLLSAGLAALASRPAGAASSTSTGVVDVIDVSGLMDRIEVDFIAQSVRQAGRDRAEALVVQLDSGGGVIGHGAITGLADLVARAAVPVAVWVGGRTGARAFGSAYDVFAAAAIRGVSPSSHVGRSAREPGSLGADAALTAGLASLNAPTLGDFIVGLDGLNAGGRTLHTARVVQTGGQPRREPTVDVSFGKLSLLPRLFHTASSPSVAYLLLVIGSLLVIFEFFTIGIGLGAVCGAGALVLAAAGLANLPIRPFAVVLIVVGCLGSAIDVQAGAPRAWTVIGTAALAVGTIVLYHGLHASPLAMVVGVVGAPLFMVAGMPSMLRSRFATPTIGRQAMIGETGEATADVDPEGTVEVRGAPWRARTNRATPIRAGEVVRVVGIDGLLLEVEPEAGGPRDYRHGA